MQCRSESQLSPVLKHFLEPVRFSEEEDGEFFMFCTCFFPFFQSCFDRKGVLFPLCLGLDQW